MRAVPVGHPPEHPTVVVAVQAVQAPAAKLLPAIQAIQVLVKKVTALQFVGIAEQTHGEVVVANAGKAPPVTVPTRL